jgi:hypothetical protein
MKDVRRFGIKGKLAPHYIGMYPILEKYGPLAYRVELPPRLSGVHNVFHVSQLKRCLKPPDGYGNRRQHSIGTRLDLQVLSDQGIGST